jgi:hypothetical protein
VPSADSSILGSVLLQSQAIAVSPLQAASPGSGHRFFEYSSMISILERSTSIAKLCTEGEAEQNCVAAVRRGEAIFASNFTTMNARTVFPQTFRLQPPPPFSPHPQSAGTLYHNFLLTSANLNNPLSFTRNLASASSNPQDRVDADALDCATLHGYLHFRCTEGQQTNQLQHHRNAKVRIVRLHLAHHKKSSCGPSILAWLYHVPSGQLHH